MIAMTNSPRRLPTLAAALLVFLVALGCGKKEQEKGPTADMPGGPPRPPRLGGGPGGSKLDTMMERIGKGKKSLSASIKAGLEAEKPEWDKLQPLTEELARITGDLGKEDPPRGSKESWVKLTGTFDNSTKELDKAVHAKDLEKARAAQKTFSGSCSTCHRAHKGRGPGGPGAPGRPSQP
jgi:hypothetical protein